MKFNDIRTYFLCFCLFVLLDLNAQHPSFISNDWRPNKEQKFIFGIMGQLVVQDLSISAGIYGAYPLVNTKHYHLIASTEVYPSLMFGGYMIGAGGKVGLYNSFRLYKEYGMMLGVGKNIRSTIYNFAQNKTDIIPIVSNFQIDIGWVEYEKVRRKKYIPASTIFISYSNISSKSMNSFYPWRHVFEFIINMNF